jgi:hypothetical protein
MGHRMRLAGLLAGVAALACGVLRADEEKKAEKKADKDGWVQLFNGKDLTGWKVHPKGTGNWKVVDKAITCVDEPANSHLFSERGDYVDFHFRVEAKINDGGNSGQYIRTKFMEGWPEGYEVQINATHTDRVKTGSIYPDYREPDLKKIKEILILDKAPHKPDEWFTQEVIAKGDHLTVFVNGKKVVDWKDPKHRHKKGRFALQQHDPGSVVQFRKIEVKELKAKE